MQNIDLEHPEYRSKKQMWKRYKDLYVGGEQLKNNAAAYLMRRQKEGNDVYQERLERVFYENYIGSIIDWYAATLFRREPVLHVEGANDAGRIFINEFAEDCDLKGTNFSDFFRRQIIDALVFGSSFHILDFPKVANLTGNRAEEDASGASRAYLVDCAPESVINWSTDAQGNYEWVVIRNTFLQKKDPSGAEWLEETRWVYYDKQEYR